MSTFVFANNVNTTLAAGINSTATTITLTSSANLPTLAAGDIFAMTLNDAATQSVFEVVYVTAISGATLTVVRGQENTAAQSWLTGDYAYGSNTKGILESFVQTGSEPGSGFVTLSPPTQQTGSINVSGGVIAGGFTTTGYGTFADVVASGSIEGAVVGATDGTYSSSLQVANGFVPPVYTSTGAALTSTTHIVSGTVSISVSSGVGTATVNLSGAAAFLSTGSYIVLVTSQNGNLCGVGLPISATSMTIQLTQVNGTTFSGAVVAQWMAIGS